MGNKSAESKKCHWDIILIACLLVLSAVFFFLFHVGEEGGAGVSVRVDGVEVATYSLEENGIYELNGGTNILVIEDGVAYLSEAHCPDELCVKQGKISKTGQVITCLPNKLTVTVYGAEADSVDLVS